jgi:hypothetical protein
MLVITHLATPIAVATACEFSSCVTCAAKEDIRPGEWRAGTRGAVNCTHFTTNSELL